MSCLLIITSSFIWSFLILHTDNLSLNVNVPFCNAYRVLMHVVIGYLVFIPLNSTFLTKSMKYMMICEHFHDRQPMDVLLPSAWRVGYCGPADHVLDPISQSGVLPLPVGCVWHSLVCGYWHASDNMVCILLLSWCWINAYFFYCLFTFLTQNNR